MTGLPSVFSVGAVQDSVADPAVIGGAGLTRIVNGVIDVLPPPELAIMVIGPVVPSSFADGVPISAPVRASKVSHAGCPDIEKVTAAPLGDVVGWNEYLIPTVALSTGVPRSAIPAGGLAVGLETGVVDVTLPPELGATVIDPVTTFEAAPVGEDELSAVCLTSMIDILVWLELAVLVIDPVTAFAAGDSAAAGSDVVLPWLPAQPHKMNAKRSNPFNRFRMTIRPELYAFLRPSSATNMAGSMESHNVSVIAYAGDFKVNSRSAASLDFCETHHIEADLILSIGISHKHATTVTCDNPSQSKRRHD